MRSLYIAVIFRIFLFIKSFAANSNAQENGKNRCGDTGNWTLYEGQCYSCTGDELSWYSARSSCSQVGAILVVISNSGIQAFLEALCTSGNYWIGLNDLLNEGTFVWDGTSTPVSYTNWSPGEPNDAGDNEDCAALRWNTWNDYICGGIFFYICQKNQG